jgi:hypothetical protein
MNIIIAAKQPNGLFCIWNVMSNHLARYNISKYELIKICNDICTRLISDEATLQFSYQLKDFQNIKECLKEHLALYPQDVCVIESLLRDMGDKSWNIQPGGIEYHNQCLANLDKLDMQPKNNIPNKPYVAGMTKEQCIAKFLDLASKTEMQYDLDYTVHFDGSIHMVFSDECSFRMTIDEMLNLMTQFSEAQNEYKKSLQNKQDEN